jgi:hypothetical protein
MKRIVFLAAAAVLAAPAVFAQTVISSSGPVILAGPPISRPLPGAVIAEAPLLVSPGVVAVAPSTCATLPCSTSVLGGPAAVVTTTAPAMSMATYYWNVPANIQHRADFQRWQRLIP